MMYKILDPWVRREYLKIKNLQEVRARGSKILLFSELNSHLPKLKSPFFYHPYEFIITAMVLNLCTALFLFYCAYVPGFNSLVPLGLSVGVFLFFKESTYRKIIDIRQGLPLTFNKLLSNRETREEDIRREINECIISYIKSNLPKEEPTSIYELLQCDPKTFIFENFNIKSPHFTQYYLERAYDPITRELNKAFVEYSLFIPKRKELGPDILRKILIHPVKVDKVASLGFQDVLFSNYTPLQLEALFTSFYDKDSINDLHLLSKEPLAVYRNFKTLIATELYRDKTLTPELKSLEDTLYPGITINVLRSLKDYEHVGNRVFDNCLGKSASYFTRGGHIIVFIKNTRPWACVLVKDQVVKEIKGPGNTDVTEPYRVEEILLKHGVIK